MQKNLFRKTISAAMALMTACAVEPGALTAHAKDYSYIRTDEISDGLTYTSETYKYSSGGSRSYIFDYTPGGNTTPIVAYGDKLYGKSDINEIVKYCQNKGFTVMAAFNSDFFSMSNGVPTGIVVREGRLCSSDGAWNAVGFTRDGRTIIGAPKLDITFSVNGGQRYPIFAFNKVRDSKGIYLYSYDYSETTHLSAQGPCVTLRKVDSSDYMTVSGNIAFKVVDSGVMSGESRLDEDLFVLTHQMGVDMGIDLTALKPGDLVTVYTGARSAGWDEVYYACGAGDMMIENSAMTEQALGVSSKGPRTMLGVRDDGSVAVLVCDGRDGSAAGMTLSEAATKLYKMGCKNVVNLDGGGSSIASMRYPGYAGSSVVSNPSDGSPRKCANFILFVASGDQYEPERYVAVYPKDELVLAGGTLELTARSYNSSYYPGSAYSDCFTVTSGGGEINGSTLTLPMTEGDIYVGADVKGLESVDARVTSVVTPETMSVVRKGSQTALSSLSLEPGESVDLDVIVTDGLRTIKSTDEQFDFAITGNIGEITPSGLFTATKIQGASGSITVSFGSTVRTVQVKVGDAPVVLREFESTSNYTVTAPEGAKGTASVNLTSDNARYGKGSLYMTYSSSVEGHVTMTADTPVAIPSGVTNLTLMTRGSGVWYIDFNTPSGVQSQRIATDDEWALVTVEKPSGAASIAGFHVWTEAGGSGSAYIDQITGHYGKVQADAQPPFIELQSFDYTLMLRITDDGEYPLEKSNVTVKIDGSAADFEFDEAGGLLTVSAPQDGLPHKITVDAKDYFGNLARYTCETPGEMTGPFGDISGHWAENYVNYLYNKGVFTADEGFRPQGSATNEMIATIISRYMGIDTAQYESVTLPYADLDKIHDWALPHVKALYSLGIMQGGGDSQGNIWFYPTDSSTRARVMTVLGRTINRGYSYTQAGYSDMSDCPAWAKDHISLLTHLGIVNGYGGENKVMPNAGITRAEIAAILYRMY